MEFHNKIAEMALKHFKNLPKTGKPTLKEWTVLSSIIQYNSNLQKFEVVALGTGSKCIGKSRMSSKGDIVNDSHAEVVCRRAFLRYLYYEIEMCYINKSDIFVFHPASQKFELISDISFHFFTTHVPCGDAAIFPKQEYDDVGDCLHIDIGSSANDNSLPSNSSKRRASFTLENTNKRIQLENNESSGDIFRTGAKCLPNDEIQDKHLGGSNYHTIGAVRTKPGRGDPTSSVSCSDKIAKWMWLGIQGSILSILLEKPIYLISFTIVGGTPYCEKSLLRALYNRFHNIDLESPYKKCHIIPRQVALEFEFSKCASKQPSPSSIIWCKSDNSVEVAVEGRKQGITKKKINCSSSRLKICKIELLRKFMNVIKQFDIKIATCDNVTHLKYGEVKCLANDYQKAWDVFKYKGFKVWPIKNITLLDFYIDK